MNSRITLRTFAFPQDYPAVHQLWENAGPGVHLGDSDTLEEIGKKLERDPDLFLVAIEDDRIVGSVLGGFDGRRGMVYHLAVHLDCRDLGIGSALMKELENRLRAKGCIKYYLLVTFDNNTAIQFYKKRGWERMPIHIYGKRLD